MLCSVRIYSPVDIKNVYRERLSDPYREKFPGNLCAMDAEEIVYYELAASNQ